MKKSTNFTTKKLSIILATAVASQLLLSVPAQASTTSGPGSSGWDAIVQWLKDCFGDKAEEKLAELQAQCQNCNKTGTPEPLTILGVGATLASLPAFKKYYQKQNKQEIV